MRRLHTPPYNYVITTRNLLIAYCAPPRPTLDAALKASGASTYPRRSPNHALLLLAAVGLAVLGALQRVRCHVPKVYSRHQIESKV